MMFCGLRGSSSIDRARGCFEGCFGAAPVAAAVFESWVSSGARQEAKQKRLVQDASAGQRADPGAPAQLGRRWQPLAQPRRPRRRSQGLAARLAASVKPVTRRCRGLAARKGNVQHWPQGVYRFSAGQTRGKMMPCSTRFLVCVCAIVRACMCVCVGV